MEIKNGANLLEFSLSEIEAEIKRLRSIGRSGKGREDESYSHLTHQDLIAFVAMKNSGVQILRAICGETFEFTE